jgi:hypothetical protein
MCIGVICFVENNKSLDIWNSIDSLHKSAGFYSQVDPHHMNEREISRTFVFRPLCASSKYSHIGLKHDIVIFSKKRLQNTFSVSMGGYMYDQKASAEKYFMFFTEYVVNGSKPP